MSVSLKIVSKAKWCQRLKLQARPAHSDDSKQTEQTVLGEREYLLVVKTLVKTIPLSTDRPQLDPLIADKLYPVLSATESSVRIEELKRLETITHKTRWKIRKRLG